MRQLWHRFDRYMDYWTKNNSPWSNIILGSIGMGVAALVLLGLLSLSQRIWGMIS